MSPQSPALYLGTVMHRRLRPRPHRLRYRVFLLLVDVDAVGASSKRLRFFSHNRFNVFSLHDRDYGAGTDEPLRSQVEEHMRHAGLHPDGGAILLLTMPRVLGYAFNPISLYFCYRRSGEIDAILYEVNNTFGQRHSYLLPVGPRPDDIVRQQCDKHFYVSPFMEMAMTYVFKVMPPGERTTVAISVNSDGTPVLNAVLSAKRAALTDASLVRIFFLYPLLTLKVTAGIHWEALLIWLKGIRLTKRPPPPEQAVTIVRHPGV